MSFSVGALMRSLAVRWSRPTAPKVSESSFVHDELTRDSRDRIEKGAQARRAKRAFAATAATFAACAVLTGVFLHGGPRFSWSAALFLVVLYAAVSRVQFEIGTGAAIPTELVLVPMLFAVPIGMVPALAAGGLLAGDLLDRSVAFTLDRVFVILTSACQALGPVLVIAAFGGLPLRWAAAPVYAAALVAQFGFDFGAAAATSHLGHRVPLRSLARFLVWVFVVDACLAPIGLAIAYSARGHVLLVAFVLPLVALLRNFSHERQRRIDHALELSDAYRGTAFLLGDVVEADDAYTGAHSRHVVDLVLEVCDDLGLPPDERRNAEFVALLHDVGKIKIPPSIINKPGPLDAEERALIQTHTVEGQVLLERVGGLLGHVGRIVRSCHEDWDGSGYPDGLAGEEIPMIARIVTACDAFSAMTTTRSYRKARSEEEACAELARCAGTQFDPRVVESILRSVQRPA
jgi:HD-GYP domain-containing protein (c-di-GMP phosphodiesterase class II)